MTRVRKIACKQRFSSGESGFSLVEILVVVAVVTIVAAITIPGVMGHLRVYRLDTAVSIISNKVREARMDAIKRNRVSTLRLDLAARTAQIRSTDNAGLEIDVGFPQRLPQNVILNAVGTVNISFDSLGRLPAGAQTFTIQETNSTMRKNISISPAGRVIVGPMY